jgi:cytidine deaminase
MNKETKELLIAKAWDVRENAYSPYSGFKVGAAILCVSGEIFTGCNVENASFGATLCAERNAISAAVSAGKTNFEAIAIVADDDNIVPCGVCRQVLSEFAGDIAIICCTKSDMQQYNLSELLPNSFTKFNIKE